MTQPSQDNIDNTVDSKGGQLNYIKQIVEDKSQLILTILAMILAVASIAMQIQRNADESIRQELIDAKIAAALAPVEEKTRTSVQNAKLAIDRADKMAAQLEAKGLIRLENH